MARIQDRFNAEFYGLLYTILVVFVDPGPIACAVKMARYWPSCFQSHSQSKAYNKKLDHPVIIIKSLPRVFKNSVIHDKKHASL